MNKQIVFTEINKAELLDTKMVSPLANQVKVKTMFSTISNGTEKANISGNANVISNLDDFKVYFSNVSINNTPAKRLINLVSNSAL